MKLPHLGLAAFVFATLCISALGQEIRTESFQGKDVVASEVIVRFRSGEVPNVAQIQALAAQGADITAAAPLGPPGMALLKSRGRSVAELLRDYQGRADVQYAEPNYIWRKSDTLNDQYRINQWGMNNTGVSFHGVPGISGADIKASSAWNRTHGGRSVVIGIIDSGVDYNHPDLADNMWSAPSAFSVTIAGQAVSCPAGSHGYNALAGNCDPMDSELHGTHVAGIAGAVGGNGIGVSGVSPVASIMALKFLDATGSGTTAGAVQTIQFATQVKAIFGVSANVRVLNASWGGPDFSQALQDAVSLANLNEMLFVAAAGNSGTNNDVTAHYPSNFSLPNVISVAATDNRDNLASFSNTGATTVHLGAPGVDILSTTPANTYRFLDGTSMAAPSVSGSAALVLSVCSITTSQLRTLLLNNTDPTASLAGKTSTGGRLNVFRALNSCDPTPGLPTFTMGTPSNAFVTPGGTANPFQVTVTPLNGFSSALDLSISGLPSGVSASFSPLTPQSGNLVSTLTLTSSSSASTGNYIPSIVSTGGGVSQTLRFLLRVIPILAPQTRISGTLSSADGSGTLRTDSSGVYTYSDYYAIQSFGNLQVDLRSKDFDTYLIVNGIENDNNSSGDSNSLITINSSLFPTLVQVTSALGGKAGDYTISLNLPVVLFATPKLLAPGTSRAVTLNGFRFSAPLTVAAAGTGVSVEPGTTTVISATQVAATLTVAANATPETHEISVTTAEGVSNGYVIPIARRATLGQAVSAALTASDLAPFALTPRHFYTFTLDVPATVRIDVSAEFQPFINLYTSDAVSVSIIRDASPNNVGTTVSVAAGLYFVEVTSSSSTLGGVGNYSLLVKTQTPTLSGITPNTGVRGTAPAVALAGTNFASPLTIDAGADITVSSVSVLSPTSVSAVFSISGSAGIGTRQVSVTTSGGVSGAVGFTVNPPPPTIGTIAPALGGTNMPVPVLIAGTNFVAPLSLAVTGGGIDATNVVVVDATSISATFTIAAGSVLGLRGVTVTTPGGTSNAGSFTVIPPPTLTSITPGSGVQATVVNVTFAGTDFVAPLTINAGSGITVGSVVVISPTSVTAAFTIAAEATPGNRNITLTTPGGTSAPASFNVIPQAPVITKLSPQAAIQGVSLNLVLTGSSFYAPMTVAVSGTGVTSGVVAISSTASATVPLTITAGAPLGARSVTVTTAGGTSSAATFTVALPFPDLSITSTHVTDFGVGFNEPYTLTVKNDGTASSSGTITVTDILPAGLTPISATGTGWACSISGQTAVCTTANTIAAGAQSGIALTVTAGASAVPGVVHAPSVSHALDLNGSNNDTSEATVVVATPTPTFTFLPSPLLAGQQATVSLAIASPFPHALTGTLTLGFTPDPTIGADDPAIQFASGGRLIPFVFPANTTQAGFGVGVGGGAITPATFQTGTLAGTLTFAGQLQSGAISVNFTPSIAAGSLAIPKQAPTIHKIQKDAGATLTPAITLSSTTREITEVSFQFVTTPTVKLSCGGIVGCTASGQTLTFDVHSVFSNWFAGGSAAGSLSVLRVPFTLSGTITGTVFVRIGNSLGVSASQSFSIP